MLTNQTGKNQGNICPWLPFTNAKLTKTALCHYKIAGVILTFLVNFINCLSIYFLRSGSHKVENLIDI